MVKTGPQALKAIGCTGSVMTGSATGDMLQCTLLKILQRGITGIVVEVTSHQNTGFGRQRPERIDRLHQSFDNMATVRSSLTLTTIAAGSMDNEDMQRVARHNTSADIEDVTGRTHAGKGFYTEGTMLQHLEGEGLIKQCHVEASFVGRAGHDIFITRMTKQRTARQVMQHRVVLDLNQCHKVRQLKRDSIGRTGNNGTPDIVQFAPVTARGPLPPCCRQELGVVLQRVVLAVKKVLTVQFHKGEKPR